MVVFYLYSGSFSISDVEVVYFCVPQAGRGAHEGHAPRLSSRAVRCVLA